MPNWRIASNTFDYLFVGNGSFGVVFAHEMKKVVKNAWCWNTVIVRAVTCTVKKKVFTSINMELAFSTRRTKKSGTTSISLSNLIITSIPL